MVEGGIIVNNGKCQERTGKLTASLFITCLVAASGGLLFGYGLGISGGVTTMESFLTEFFPGVLRKKAEAKKDVYCVFNSHVLTAFTSSMYIAGLVASLVAGRLTKTFGRLTVMLLGAASFFVGALVNAAAMNIELLILGRILLGFGIGFSNQATPVYLVETAPPQWRGAFTNGFQFFIGIGVLVASIINYLTARIPRWGWRLSVGLATVPSVLILTTSLFITDTPTSLIMRNKPEKALAALQHLRGSTAMASAEFDEAVQYVEKAKKVEEGAYRRIKSRRYRMQLVMAVLIPVFTSSTGIIVVAFFAPVLFETVGFGSQSALMGAVILGGVNMVSILASTFTIDRCGRRKLLVLGGSLMISCQVAVAWILGAQIGSNGKAMIPRPYAVGVLIMMCIFALGFGISWGPVSALVPSEIFPVEIRSAAQSICVAVDLGCIFLQTQTFLAMLCSFKFGTFVYFAAWVVVMTAFVVGFLPETKGVPLEAMEGLWESHWYWSKFAKQEGNEHHVDVGEKHSTLQV